MQRPPHDRVLKAFLKYLALNRSVSRHTVRAYESDLSQFLDHAAAGAGVKPRDLAPSALDRSAIRSFLSTVNAKGQSRATAARKLAAIRTFLRYLRREDAISADPGFAGAARPNAKSACRRTSPRSEMTRLLDAPDVSEPLGRRDQRDSSSCSMRRACASASSQDSTSTTSV